MSALICPICQKSGLNWLNYDSDNFNLDDSIMVCKGCHHQFIGIAGWQKAWDTAQEFRRNEAKVTLDIMYARAKQMGWIE